MNKALVEHYRFPPEMVCFQPLGDFSSQPSYFRLGADTICYGRPSSSVTGHSYPGQGGDAMAQVRFEGGRFFLPFDPTELVENLRRERYAGQPSSVHPGLHYRRLLRKTYYFARPVLPLPLRRFLQKIALRQWKKIRFPQWPVDTSVEIIFENLVRMALEERHNDPLPFIWFWPDGRNACLVMTHDVETETGRDFCTELMDLDDSAGLKASFQLVPEKRYTLSLEFLERIRNRGFEVNVHDLNHDGKLFDSREIFQERYGKINDYMAKFEARGFRSGALYRNLDWLANLNIQYDMSVPNVAHLEPQRGGCCTVMPYFIDSILELPLTMAQDYGLFHALGDYSINMWKKQLEIVFQKHGLACFDIHPDYVRSRRALAVYRDLLRCLNHLLNSGGLWMALPSEVNDWWRQRSRMKLVRKDDKWRVVGAGCERARVAYASLVEGKLKYEVEEGIPPAAMIPTISSSCESKLNVLVISYSFYDSDGRVRKYAESLAERGDHVDAIALRRRGQLSREVVCGVNVHRIQERERNERSRGSYLLKILTFLVNSFVWSAAKGIRRRYDLVHIHSVPDFEVFAAFVPKLLGAKLILDIHDIVPEFYASKFGCDHNSWIFRMLLRMEKISVNFVNHVIISNDLWKDKLTQRSAPSEKCTAVLNYPDSTLFYPRAGKKKSEKTVFMYPGTLNSHQGLDIAIQAFNIVKNRLPSAEFHIIGGGPDKPLLEKLVRDLGLTGRVRIMDSVPIETVAEKMAAADIGIIPKRANLFGDEAFSTKSMEFMALGVPVIMSRTRIDSHYFDDSVVTFFESGDHEALAGCMYDLATNLELWERMSRNALEFVSQCTWQAKRHTYYAMVDRLATAKHSGSDLMLDRERNAGDGSV